MAAKGFIAPSSLRGNRVLWLPTVKGWIWSGEWTTFPGLCQPNRPKIQESPVYTVYKGDFFLCHYIGTATVRSAAKVRFHTAAMQEMVKDFLVESYENLDKLDEALVDLEKDPTHRASLDSIFRTLHTIKGTCGFLAFSKLEKVSHAGENLLGRLREGKIQFDTEVITALLTTVDAIREVLEVIENTGKESEAEYPELIERLSALSAGETQAATPPPKTISPSEPAPQAEQAPPAKPAREKVLVKPEAPVPAAQAPLARSKASAAKPEPAKAEGSTRNISDSTVRVDVDLLDKLMNLVGELVLARNQHIQLTSRYSTDSQFVGIGQRLNLVTSELQEGVMKTRLQPIGNIWNNFPRVVRDLSVSCGKKVSLNMEGKETELDRTVIEAIKDPLTHLVRNSVDHGIEAPNERVRKGKPEEGQMLLRAFHEGGQVNIELSDDGAGIDPEKVKNSALKRNLVSQEEVARMSDRDLVRLIFQPSLSTAEKVTNVSGRGVGMDVVKTNIEKTGGSVDLQSTFGVGTTVKIKIPLTLAIIPALIVTCGGHRYAIPQVSLLELVRLEGGRAGGDVELINGSPVYRLRGDLLPLVYLANELGIETKQPPVSSNGRNNGVVNIVVLGADKKQFGLVVEGINNTEEIVVKPLGKQVKNVTIFSGATIMGNGKVALILDVFEIAQKAKVIADVSERSLREAETKFEKNEGDRQSLLLIGVNEDERLAIPLSQVARLEKLPHGTVEQADSRKVVQYRGKLMPLIYLADALNRPRAQTMDSRRPINVVVYTLRDRSVGFVVDRIVDIVEEEVSVEQRSNSTGVIGTVVIQGRATDLLNVEEIIHSSEPSFFEETATTA